MLTTQRTSMSKHYCRFKNINIEIIYKYNEYGQRDMMPCS